MASLALVDHAEGFQVVHYAPGEEVKSVAPSPATGPANVVNAHVEAAAPAPSAAVVRTGPAAQMGDFILTHSSGIYGTLIRVGERLRYMGKEKIFAHWSHSAIFVNDTGDIIEALGGGVQKRNISVYRGTEYVVVHLPRDTSEKDRSEVVAFASYSLRQGYGWLTIVSIALNLLSGSKLGFGVDGQQICSALVARCIERIGEIFTENEPWHMMPADLAKHFEVRLVGNRGSIPSKDTGVMISSKPGRRRRQGR
jgi:uncharacterized protein YycO